VPEGDTIFRAARTLHQALAGRTVVRFDTVLPALGRVDEDARLVGQAIDRVWAVGKHLLIAFSGGLVLRTHMRMHGSWHVYRPGERWRRPHHQVRVAIHTDAFVAVGFSIPVAEFVAAASLGRHEPLAQLGPDVLSPTFVAAEAVARLRARGDMPIGEALLDQRALAGIGNVYKSEICFLCAVHPATRVSALPDGQIVRLVEMARRLLRLNVSETSGAAIATTTGLRRTTRSADPSARLWVYGRRGRPCRRCGTAIRAQKQGADARTTYWCERCQQPGPGVQPAPEVTLNGAERGARNVGEGLDGDPDRR
jgi:endonuclease VIII